MRTAISILASVLVLVAIACPMAYAQASLSSTTLSAAITSGATTFRVASATGITAGSTRLYVDRELMDVRAVSGTLVTVARGMGGTRASGHISGAVVYLGNPNYFGTVDRVGSCTAGNESVLPATNVNTGAQFECIRGQWVQVNSPGLQRTCYARYSFAKDGGAVSTITPATNCVIPAKSIITNVFINSTTAVTSGGGATVAIGTSAGSSTTALLGATAIASLGADAKVVGVPVPQTAATWVKLSATGKVTCTVAVADLTAGVIEVFITYLVPNA